MSVWIPPGHRTHDGQPDCDVRWCECSGRCTSNAPCDCCELAELRIEVERLTAALAERDQRIEAALDLMDDRANSSPGYPLLERVLRGESG